MLHRRDIDIAPVDFLVTKARASVVDYLPGISPLYAQIFIRNPKVSNNWDAYRGPLTPQGWLAILIVLIVAPVLIAGISMCGK